jgi:hypothetical protein
MNEMATHLSRILNGFTGVSVHKVVQRDRPIKQTIRGREPCFVTPRTSELYKMPVVVLAAHVARDQVFQDLVEERFVDPSLLRRGVRWVPQGNVVYRFP